MRFLLVVLSWLVLNTEGHSAFPNNLQTPFGGQVNLAKSLCSACISGLEAGKRTSWVSPRVFLSELTVACQSSRQTTPDVCEGLVKEQGPVIVEVLKHMDVTNFDGHLFCAAVLGACDYPASRPFQLVFPKPKPVNATAPRVPSGRNITVLHLSDWHFDPEYQVGSEAACDKPLCCRPDSRSSSAAKSPLSNIVRPASPWGDYACDAPFSLHESLLSFIAQNITPQPTFAILTGDIPPHNVWETLPTSVTQHTEQIAYELLRSYFGPESILGVSLYPAVGNHEVAPVNLFPPQGVEYPELPGGDATWLYDSLAKIWEAWLGENVVNDMQNNRGSYMIKAGDSLRIVSMNTNFCYVNNWWLFRHTNDTDPNNMLAWLIDQLQLAEDAGDRVWIIGHHPPGVSDCFHEYSARFSKIVERYTPHVIAGHFMGHTHKDEFEVFYEDGVQDAEHAISVAYIAPSVTPYRYINPGFRLYTVDAETYDVLDSITYIANLSQADKWANGPDWQVEYSAQDAYTSAVNTQLESTSTTKPVRPLSAAWWHHLTAAFETDEDMFQRYFFYYGKSAGLLGECNEKCKATLVCDMRAGNSELGCRKGRIGAEAIIKEEWHTTEMQDKSSAQGRWALDLCTGLND